jgi:hypothetical protein
MSHIYAPHTFDRIVFNARIRFLQLTKPQAHQLALKAGYCEKDIEGVTVTTLKNMLTRRYLLGAIVAVWKRFPAEVVHYMGAFFDLDIRRTIRNHAQIQSQMRDIDHQISCVEFWFRRYEHGGYNVEDILPLQIALRENYLKKREISRLSCESDTIAEDFMTLLKEEKQMHLTLRADRHKQFIMNRIVYRTTRDEDLYAQLNAETLNAFERREIADKLLINEKMAELIAFATHFVPDVRSQMARKREHEIQAKRERQQEWLAVKAQEKKAAAAAVRQTKEEARLAQRALDRKRVKKEITW